MKKAHTIYWSVDSVGIRVLTANTAMDGLGHSIKNRQQSVVNKIVWNKQKLTKGNTKRSKESL